MKFPRASDHVTTCSIMLLLYVNWLIQNPFQSLYVYQYHFFFYIFSHRAFSFKTLPTFTHIAGSVLYSLKRLESQALPQYRRWLFTLSQPFEDSNPIRSDEAPLKRILRILTKKKKYFIFLKLYLIICIYAYLYTYMSRRLLIASDRTIIGYHSFN